MEKVIINVIDELEKEHKLTVDMDENMSLMEVLRSYDFIEGACGGMTLCATCHCYIQSNNELPSQKDEELSMLDQLFSLDEKTSRLACQIPITKAINNIIVKIAPAD